MTRIWPRLRLVEVDPSTEEQLLDLANKLEMDKPISNRARGEENCGQIHQAKRVFISNLSPFHQALIRDTYA